MSIAILGDLKEPHWFTKMILLFIILVYVCKDSSAYTFVYEINKKKLIATW